LQTAKPKSSRNRIIAVVIIIALIVGGAASYLVLFQPSRASTPPDFGILVYSGDANQPNTWQAITNTTTALNGTSVSLVVTANATGGFNDFVQVSFTSPLSGVTGTFVRTTLRPQSGGSSTTGLNLTIAPDIATRKLYYNFTVTGTSGTVSHKAVFPLRIRASTLQVTPSVDQVLKPNSFKVGVGISDIYSFYAFQITLNFNSSFTQAVNDNVAPIFYPSGTIVGGQLCDNLPPPVGPCDGFLQQNSIDNTLGEVTVTATLLGQCVVTAPCVDSPGNNVFTIFNVTFTSNSTSAGPASFKLTNTLLTVLDGEAVSILPFHPLNSGITVIDRNTMTSLSCIPATVAANVATTCTATVTDASPGTVILPTGSVTFSSNATGSFSTPSCTLSGTGSTASCQVTYTPTTPLSTHTITAIYVADTRHIGSSGKFDLSVS